MDKKYLSTKEVLQKLGVKISWLNGVVWKGWLREPLRGPGRFFLWADCDIRRAAELLNKGKRAS